jgi:hypothetical protein
VDVLRKGKTYNQTISQCIRNFFEDETFSNYSIFTGNNRKKDMKTYEIFGNCMLEAWPNLDAFDLETQLKDATTKCLMRLRKRRQRARYSLEKKGQSQA